MPAVTKDEAVDRLAKAIEKAHADDVVDIYNELFPEEPVSASTAQQDGSRLLARIVSHIQRGLEIEEIVDLWHVVFPSHRRVQFDEETGTLSYREGSEPFQYVD